MTVEPGPTDGRVARLEERLDRERKARRQAEMIAERGMRDLWEINRELQQRVDERTAQIGRLLAGYERAGAAWSAVMSDELERLERAATDGTITRSTFEAAVGLAGFARRELAEESFSARPAAVAADIMQRWQRPIARHGQLLTTDVDTTDDEACVRWDCVIALCEVAIASIVRACDTGVVGVRLAIDGRRLVVSVEHPPIAGESGARDLQAATTIVERIAAEGAGSVAWSDAGLEAAFPVAV